MLTRIFKLGDVSFLSYTVWGCSSRMETPSKQFAKVDRWTSQPYLSCPMKHLPPACQESALS